MNLKKIMPIGSEWRCTTADSMDRKKRDPNYFKKVTGHRRTSIIFHNQDMATSYLDYGGPHEGTVFASSEGTVLLMDLHLGTIIAKYERLSKIS